MRSFRLAESEPQLVVFRLIVVLGGATILVVLWAAIAATDGSFTTGALITGFLVVWSAGMVALFGWSRRGVVDLGDEGLVVTRSFGRAIYPWSDIVSIRLGGADQRNEGATGKDSTATSPRRFAEIVLTRRPRIGIVPGRHGTSALGVPVGRRSVALYVTNPEDLVTAASTFLSD